MYVHTSVSYYAPGKKEWNMTPRQVRLTALEIDIYSVAGVCSSAGMRLKSLCYHPTHLRHKES